MRVTVFDREGVRVFDAVGVVDADRDDVLVFEGVMEAVTVVDAVLEGVPV